MIKKIKKILLNTIPVLVMIGFIPFVKNDFLLTSFYVVIIIASLVVRYERKDFLLLVFGFFIMIIFESIFITTGVEVFNRNSLLGIMPLWLPFLWSYGFVAIKRSVTILND